MGGVAEPTRNSRLRYGWASASSSLKVEPAPAENYDLLRHKSTLRFLIHGLLKKDNVVFDYLRAAARKVTRGKAVTFYLLGNGRPNFQYTVVDYLRGHWPRHALFKTLVWAT